MSRWEQARFAICYGGYQEEVKHYQTSRNISNNENYVEDLGFDVNQLIQQWLV